MLLRSSSSPTSGSMLPHYKEYSSHESELIHYLPRTISVVNTKQNSAHTDLQNTASKPEKKNCIPCGIVLKNKHSINIKDSEGVDTKASPSIRELLSSSGLDKQVLDHEEGGAEKKVGGLQTLVMGNGMGSDGGKICGGGHGSGWDFSDEDNHRRDRTDAYYKNMIEANPDNALLLGNYAKFLKEVCGDYPKAEEYLGRAILANPGDANLLSLYADLIWQTEKNADRAEGYFDQAVKNAPDDCYVLASYAKFLWDAEEDEEKDKECQYNIDHRHKYPPDLFQGTNHHHHFTAAS